MCGIFGIYGDKNAAYSTYMALYALQHRGQESAGIASCEGKTIHCDKGMGLVSELFVKTNQEAKGKKIALENLVGDKAIGQVRYSTAGSSEIANAQPLVLELKGKKYALAFNGNIVNEDKLKEELQNDGAVFSTNSDTEIILHYMARSKKRKLENIMSEALQKVRGAYSLVIMTENEIMAARDPYGFRPLSIGKINDTYALSSEDCAFDLLGGEMLREIEPGEIIRIDSNGTHSEFMKKEQTSFCIFEHIYFARPDSVINNEYVSSARKSLGRQLAKEHPVDADIVIPILESGKYSAWGFSDQTGIPLEFGLNRNQYVARTFIMPNKRASGVRLKQSPVKKILRGKKVVMVDDSIVRATTTKQIIKIIKEAGAKEVHVRISSPPITNSCYYGIDTHRKDELIASKKTVEEIKKYVQADSLGYISLQGMLDCMKNPCDHFCTACFTGKYRL